MKNKQVFGLFALGVIALLGVSFVAAYHGDYSSTGPNYSEDRHETMIEIFDNLDYDAWVELMTENGKSPRILNIVTEDNFAVFVEAHEAGMSGDFEKASELRAELGLNNGIGPKDGTGFKNKHMEGQGSRNGSGMKGSMNEFGMREQGSCSNLG